MQRFKALIERARSGPVYALPLRAGRFARRRAGHWVQRQRDRRRTTTLSDREFARLLGIGTAAAFKPIVDKWMLGGVAGASLHWTPIADANAIRSELLDAGVSPDSGLRSLVQETLAHRFDLLGSGPVDCSYTTATPGAFGNGYRMVPGEQQEERQLERMSALLNRAAGFTGDTSAALSNLQAALRNYRPIDWHLDFKSGYRWNPRTWAMDVPYGHRPGVDIKVPWELSRSHHLVGLAVVALMDRDDGTLASEIALQLLDWIAANPPRFGVNWRSAMDTAIRAANWIWTLTLLDKSAAVPQAVRWLAAKSLYQHALHIEANLDNQGPYTSNHYLADIVGLMHIAFAYPSIPQSDRWLRFTLQELTHEMRTTVFPDGVSYEGSTGYHRLVAEMFLHGTLLALRLSPERRAHIGSSTNPARGRSPDEAAPAESPDLEQPHVFPEWYLQRLSRMVDYAADTTKPNGLSPQVGDQDSGRFVKLSPITSTAPSGSLREEPRDHRHIVTLGRAMLGEQPLSGPSDPHRLEALALVSGLQGLPLPVPGEDASAPQRFGPPQSGAVHRYGTVWYPDGGTCLLRRGEFWVAVRCGPTQPGPGGHKHNDQLSFELNVRGQDFVIDWGSGAYTADPELRNQLRSTHSHSTLTPSGVEQNTIPRGRLGLFVLHDKTQARCIEVAEDRFAGRHTAFRAPHTRCFLLKENALVLTDSLAAPRGTESVITLAPDVRVERRTLPNALTLIARDVALDFRVEPPPQIEVRRGVCAEAYGVLRESHQIVMRHEAADTRMTFALGANHTHPASTHESSRQRGTSKEISP